MNSKLLKAVIMFSKRFLQICFIQILFYSVVFANGAKTQDKSLKDIYIQMDVRQAETVDLFMHIEANSSFRFNFDDQDLNQEVSYNFRSRKYSVYDILSAISKEASLAFRRINDHIDVSRISSGGKVQIEEVYLEKTITGVVTDEQSAPLPGANVLVKGTTIGTVTDVNGTFSLNVPDEADILVISYVGYHAKEVRIGEQSVINVALTADVAALDEIVVVGYGTQAKKDVTGAYSSIDAEVLENRPIVSAEQGLQGTTPGIQIFQADASPGQLSEIYVRGVTNLSTGTNPLFVIDGFATEDQRLFQALNPADIAKIDILKDASASAIYGSRGANGVIIVTTKSGKSGDSKLNVSVSTGVATIPNSTRPDLLNASEYVQYYTESYANRGITDPGAIPDYIDNWDRSTDTDWVDAILQKGLFQNYAISTSGGSEKTDYLLSANYIRQEGTVTGESFEKYSVRLKTAFRPTKNIEIGINIAPNYNIERRSSAATGDGGNTAGTGGQLITYASFMPPTVPIRNPDGSFTDQNDFGNLANPLEIAENFRQKTERFRLLSNAYVSIEIIDGLTLRSSLGATYGSDVFEQFVKPNGVQRGDLTRFSLDEIRTTRTDWLNENTLTYKRSFGDHNFDVVGGYTAQKEEVSFVDVDGRGFSIDGPTVLGFSDQERENAGNGKTAQSLTSILGRINYSYKDKYLLTASIRRDGSSRFGSENRYATFSSAALGWRISQEPFMSGVNFINDAKIRVSYGESGNNAIPNTQWRANLNPTNVPIGASLNSAVVNANPGNVNLTWETSQQINVGFDLTAMDNKLHFTFDYFDIATSGLLLSRPLVPSTAFADFLENIGEMDAKGVEIAVDATVVESGDFSLNVGGNVSYNDNEVTNLGGNTELQNFWGVFRHELGQEIDQIYGSEIIGVARPGDGSDLAPGEPIWNDVNGDGSFSNFLGPDRVSFGSPTIHWIYGINLAAKFKNFQLTALLQGQAGQRIQDFYITQIANGINNRNMLREAHFEGRYVDESNPGDGITPFAGFMGLPGSPASVSSFGIQKTDYLRIRNITLSYYVPTSFLDRIGVSSATVYTSVENLHTFTDFMGGNPDSRRNQGGPFGGARLGGTGVGGPILQYGLITTAVMPLPRTWTVGVNFSF